MKEEWTKRGEMPSIPGAAVLSEETQAWSRRVCYVSRQVPGDKCGIVRMTFPVSLMCMCRGYSECTCGVGKAVPVWKLNILFKHVFK